MAIDYHTYINSPEWREKAEACISRAGDKCQVCSSHKYLNAHHNTYERLGHELDTDLCCLCRRCHELFHDVQKGIAQRQVGEWKDRDLPSRKAERQTKRQSRKAARKAQQRGNERYQNSLRKKKWWENNRDWIGSQKNISREMQSKGAVSPRLLKHSQNGNGGTVQPAPVPPVRVGQMMAKDCSGVSPTIQTLASTGI